VASPPERVALFLGYLGANVRRLRIARGMTQEELSEAAEIAPRFLQQVERGQTNVGAAVIVSLADALGVLPGALFRKTKAPPEPKRGRPRKARRSQAPPKDTG